jgi:basic amino acid/polyamine antiporter, APA family
MRPAAMDRALAVAGALVGASLLAMKLVPAIPGHFTLWEFIALGAWLALGAAMRRPAEVAGGN